MGRLIDADAFKAKLEELQPNLDLLASMCIDEVIELIDEQPTAYSVGKVVAELEELANHYHKCCLVDYNEGAEVGVRETMAIVRKGGVE